MYSINQNRFLSHPKIQDAAVKLLSTFTNFVVVIGWAIGAVPCLVKCLALTSETGTAHIVSVSNPELPLARLPQSNACKYMSLLRVTSQCPGLHRLPAASS